MSQDTECPRIFMVSRSHCRKGKQIDYVGEFHLEWIQSLGGLPVILPRTPLTIHQISQYFPMDGLLLMEGEDLSPEYNPYGSDGKIDPNIIASVRQQHPADVSHDRHKDQVEWTLLTMAIEQDVPILGICRGCQLINVAYGGSLYFDVINELPNSHPHIRYEKYDEFRHPLHIVPNSPLAKWYEEEIGPGAEKPIQVNSYHHQGVKHLSSRLTSMAFSTDGLVEGVFDPLKFSPEEGRFCVGVQFHPERLGSKVHHGGGLKVYQSFVTAARNFSDRRKRKERREMNGVN